MTLEHYEQPGSLEEAYRLVKEENGTVLGGMLWLRLQPQKRIVCGVDLSLLGLNSIEKADNEIRIGAYVTLRQWERDEWMAQYSHGMIGAAVKPIVGVQFRNLATLGGSIASRFGFSDVACLGTALGMEAEYYRYGRISVEELMQKGKAVRRELLTHLILPGEAPFACAYVAQRNSSTDLPVLNACVAVRSNGMNCAVGARPGSVRAFHFPNDILLDTEIARHSLAEQITAQLTFDSNRRASAAYRKQVCEVLLRRALKTVHSQLHGEEKAK